jgi:nonribosomal peptide synthetase DhbF
LFCVHPAAGLSWCYAGLLQHLRAPYPIYGLQARGLRNNESPHLTLEQMVAHYLDQIRKVQPGGPYHLLGWSFGGMVAYAIATELQLQGEQVALLAVLDGYPIDKETPRQTRDERQSISAYLQNLGSDPATLRERSLQLSTIKELLQRESHIPSNLEDRHLPAILEVYKNNERLSRTFIPKQLKGDLLLFAATHRKSAPPTERWRPYVSGQVDVHPIACRHGQMTQPGPIAEIGRVLAIELEKRRTTF